MKFRTGLDGDPLNPVLVAIHKHPNGVFPRLQSHRRRRETDISIIYVQVGSRWF